MLLEPNSHRLWPIHRADLQQVLLKAALERGVVVKLGCRVIAIEGDSEIVAVLTKDGEKIEADLLVGADGTSKHILSPTVSPDPYGRAHFERGGL
jgi:salicylate hydroxylase